MLTELRIRNFAIIESVTLPLAPGFNVLTGETGAGKSIIVGALSLLLGERASAEMVRTGADRATIEGVFDLAGLGAVASALDAHGIEVDDDTLVLKREVAATGARARAWINGSPVTAALLAEAGRLLVNLHGQHEAQALLDETSQRAILDLYADASADAERVAVAWTALHDARSAISALKSRRDDAERRADYLRHVANEIAEARLVEGEEGRIEEEARRLEHAEELRALAGEVRDTLDGGDDAVVRRLAHLQRPLSALQRIDTATVRLQELYDAAYYALEELSREAAGYVDGVERDPERLAEIERRRDVIHRLLRKYGGTIEAAVAAGRAARSELDVIDTASVDLRALEAGVVTATEGLREAAAALTAKRRTGAAKLARSVEQHLPALGMPAGRFLVDLHTHGEIAASGAEEVGYRVALNEGHEARSLARVASGGELSRVMLALKAILARLDHVPTLVFDEVDAGIGGKVGLMVGDEMRRVAAHHQVFAITHLPQIAARAHHHLVVSKGARGGVTTADIAVVRDEARVTELARMLGGDAESAVSRDHARELLTSAADAPAPRAGRAAGQRPKIRP